MNADWYQFAVQNARDQFRPVTTPKRAPAEGPKVYCAMHAHVVETDGKRSIWRCPVCARLWSVAC